MLLGELLLSHTVNLSKTLQFTHMSAAEGQKIAEMTASTLRSMRTDKMFALFWTKVTRMASDHEVNHLVVPRQRKRTKQYKSGTGEMTSPKTVQDYYHPMYYEALDLLDNSINLGLTRMGTRHT